MAHSLGNRGSLRAQVLLMCSSSFGRLLPCGWGMLGPVWMSGWIQICLQAIFERISECLASALCSLWASKDAEKNTLLDMVTMSHTVLSPCRPYFGEPGFRWTPRWTPGASAQGLRDGLQERLRGSHLSWCPKRPRRAGTAAIQ